MVTRDLGGQPAGSLPRIGEVFAGRYAIDAVLGDGGFGTVFAAKDASLGREVAIKVLSRRPDATALARFLQEARAAAALQAENVIVVYEAGAAGDVPYIVMERLAGSDLHAELDRRGRFPVDEAVDLVLQAALGLAHAHAREIVHRDLKPRNLFLARRADGVRVVKILDFGIAKAGPSELTESGATLGTPRYMAPEQLRSSRAVDARTDIWALGAVLYELIAGAPAFTGDHTVELAVRISLEPHAPLATHAREVPAGIEAVLDRCLAKEPDQRHGDLAELAAALAPFATEAGRALVPRIEHALGAHGRATVRPPRERPAARSRRGLYAGVAAAAGVVAIGVAIAIAASRDGSTAATGADAPPAPPDAAAAVVADVAPALAADAAPPPAADAARRAPAALRCDCLPAEAGVSRLCLEKVAPRCHCRQPNGAAVCRDELVACTGDDCFGSRWKCPDPHWLEEHIAAGVHGGACAGFIAHGRPAVGARWTCHVCPDEAARAFRGRDGQACEGFRSDDGTPARGTLVRCTGG